MTKVLSPNRMKLGVLSAATLTVAICGATFGLDYWHTVHAELDDIAEWSILQAAHQANKTRTADACSPISYVFKDSKAIGFWSSEGWVWILIPSHESAHLKVLPEGAKFYVPRAGIGVAIAGLREPAVVEYIRANAVAACP